MTTITEENFNSFELPNDHKQFTSDFKSNSDDEIIYLNINDLRKDRNNFFCDESSKDSIGLCHYHQQLPSIELLLQTEQSIDKSQWCKANWTDCLFESQLSSKLCLTMESNLTFNKNFANQKFIFPSSSFSSFSSASSPTSSLSSSSSSSSSSTSSSTVSTTTPPIKQLKIYRGDNDCHNGNSDYYYYIDDFGGYVDHHVTLDTNFIRENCDKVIKMSSDDYREQSEQLTNRINKHRSHQQCFSQFNCYPDNLSKSETITSSLSSFISSSSSPPPPPSASSTTTTTTAVITTRSIPKGKARFRNKRVWKKYSKKKNLSQDELERKRDLANQQERTRMHRLNSALRHLRSAIPYEFSRHPPEKNLSKIKTLRIAIEYIRELTSILNEQC